MSVYLISQLPSLDGMGENTPLPITYERFFELCNRLLDKKTLAQMEKITLTPPKDDEGDESSFVDRWNDSERTLRLALGKVRAEKMKKPFDTKNKVLPVEHIKAANMAMEIENPMEAEKYLNQYRLGLLEAIRPLDNFSKDFIFYYAIKLTLILRIKQFDTQAGETAYRNIYNSILNGDKLEATQ